MRYITQLSDDKIPDFLDEMTRSVERQEVNETIQNPDLLRQLDDLMNDVASAWGFDGLFYVHEACPIRLDRNLDPHADLNYIHRYGLHSEPLLLVVGSEYGQQAKPDDGFGNYLYCHNMGMSEHLKRGDVIQFNATLPHAVMVSGEVRCVTLWLKPKLANQRSWTRQ